MTAKLILSGDINLMNVTDPLVPFSLVRDEFRGADLVFSNLECCLCAPSASHSLDNEGFFADPAIAGEALKSAGIQVVGIANNVNYGEAAITASIARLDQIGIPHTGAGANRAAARQPIILERGGFRVGFLQRSSVYWPTNHEAGENAAGIAVIADIPPIKPRCTAAAHRPIGRASRRKSSPGPTSTICNGSRKTSRHCALRPISSSPHAIGVSAATCCNT